MTERTPLLQTQTSQGPAGSGLLDIANAISAKPGETDDVALVGQEPDSRRSYESKSTLVFDGALEDDLASTERGRSLLTWLRVTVIGQLVQCTLLLMCLGIYTFTPEVIAWSKTLDTGLSRVVYSVDSGTVDPEPGLMPPIAKTVEKRKIALTADNFPAMSAGSVMVEWSGQLELPAEGTYEFELAGTSLASNAIVEPKSIKVGGSSCGGQRCGTASGARSVLSEPQEEAEEEAGELLQLDAQLADKGVSVNQLVPFKAMLTIGEPVASTDGVNIELMVKVNGGDAQPVPMKWTHIDTDLTPVYKGKPYLDSTPVVANKIFTFATALLIAFLLGGRDQVGEAFSLSPDGPMRSLAPCAIAYAIADVAEILANSGMDPTVYIILSQSRLLLTALTMRLVIGTQQSQMQWVDLTVLTLLICIFQFTPQDFLKPDAGKDVDGNFVLGMTCTLVKIMMSVFAGVYLQLKLQQAKATPFAVQLCAMNLVALPFTILLVLPVSCYLTGTLDQLLQHGPLAGPDGYWDYRTFAVVGMYVLREWATNLAVKRFDALVKNLCNAGASLLSYIFGIWVMHRVRGLVVEGGRINIACVSKLCTILGVMLLVYNYSIGKLYVRKSIAKA